jgi:hypothetical protein
MNVGPASALQDVTQRFTDSVSRVVSAARGVSESSPNGGDLAGAMVDMSVNQRVAQGTLSAVKVSNELTSTILDIVA